MNIYLETYNMVQLAKQCWYNEEVQPFKLNPTDEVVMDEQATIKQWLYVAKYLQKNASQEIIAVAANKYPILKQIFNGEDEI